MFNSGVRVIEVPRRYASTLIVRVTTDGDDVFYETQKIKYSSPHRQNLEDYIDKLRAHAEGLAEPVADLAYDNDLNRYALHIIGYESSTASEIEEALKHEAKKHAN